MIYFNKLIDICINQIAENVDIWGTFTFHKKWKRKENEQ